MTKDEQIELLIRQFGFLLADGVATDKALETLKEKVPPALLPDAERLAEVVNRAEAGSTRRPGSFGLVSQAMVLAAGAGVQPDKTLLPMLTLSKDLRSIGRRTRRAFQPKIVYSAFLALFGLLLSTLLVTHILPAFAALYTDFRAPMPVYTAALVRSGLLGLPLAFLVLFLVAIVVWFLARIGSGKVMAARPLDWPLKSLTGFGALARACDTRIGLVTCNALIVAGAGKDWLTGEADKLLERGASRAVLTALDVAEKTDTLDSEIHHQLGENEAQIETLLKAAGHRALIAFKTLLFIALAALIISFYLPILQFGEIVSQGLQ